MGIAELRRSVESPGGDVSRTVPLLERNDRQRSQAARLSGIDTEAWPLTEKELAQGTLVRPRASIMPLTSSKILRPLREALSRHMDSATKPSRATAKTLLSE